MPTAEEGSTQNFLKNVTLQALNLFIGHPVFLLQSQELKLLPVSPAGKGIPTEMSKKALVISSDKLKPPNYSSCVNGRANRNPKSKLQIRASNTIYLLGKVQGI